MPGDKRTTGSAPVIKGPFRSVSSAGVRFSLGRVALHRQPTAELKRDPASHTTHALRFHRSLSVCDFSCIQ